MAVEEAKKICRMCKRYNNKEMKCRKYDEIKHPNSGCDGFEMQLADHFVANIWDDWKNRKEKERNERAVNRKKR